MEEGMTTNAPKSKTKAGSGQFIPPPPFPEKKDKIPKWLITLAKKRLKEEEEERWKHYLEVRAIERERGW